MLRWTSGTRARADRTAREDEVIAKPTRPLVSSSPNTSTSTEPSSAPASTATSMTRAEKLLRAMVGPTMRDSARHSGARPPHTDRRRPHHPHPHHHRPHQHGHREAGRQHRHKKRDTHRTANHAETPLPSEAPQRFRFTSSQEEGREYARVAPFIDSPTPSLSTPPPPPPPHSSTQHAAAGEWRTVTRKKRDPAPSAASAASSSTVDCQSLRCALEVPAPSVVSPAARGTSGCQGEQRVPARLLGLLKRSQPETALRVQTLNAPWRGDGCGGDAAGGAMSLLSPTSPSTAAATAKGHQDDVAVAELFAEEPPLPGTTIPAFPWEDQSTAAREAETRSRDRAEKIAVGSPSPPRDGGRNGPAQPCQQGIVGVWGSPPPQAPPSIAVPVLRLNSPLARGGGFEDDADAPYPHRKWTAAPPVPPLFFADPTDALPPHWPSYPEPPVIRPPWEAFPSPSPTYTTPASVVVAPHTAHDEAPPYFGGCGGWPPAHGVPTPSASWSRSQSAWHTQAPHASSWQRDARPRRAPPAFETVHGTGGSRHTKRYQQFQAMCSQRGRGGMGSWL